MKPKVKQQPSARAWGIAAFLVGLVALGVFVGFRRPWRRPPPFQISYWYWQSPFELDDKLAGCLREMGVKQLFVRAGTWSTDGTNIVLVAPQSYGSGVGSFPIHLVFNADGGVVRHFEDLDNKRIARQVADRIVSRVALARRAGVQVIGVQLDIDCPTRLLPKYAEFVRLIRAADPLLARIRGLQFSATGLASWLNSANVHLLARQLDFLVPQAYEGETGRTVDQVRPVFDPDDLRRRLVQAESLPCPYWIGVPAYGHAFLFDDMGQLDTIYRGLEAPDALRHPSFVLETAYPSDRLGKPAMKIEDWVGEEVVRLRAVKPTADGQGLGYRLVYTLPTPSLFERALAIVRQGRQAGCQGAIVYRVPEPGSAFTVPIESMLAIRAGRQPKLSVNIQAKLANDALEATETDRPEIPADLYLDINADGDEPTYVAPDAFQLSVTVDPPGFGDAHTPGFDHVAWLRTGQPSPPSRADTAVLFRSWMYPGQNLHTGPIRLLHPAPSHVKISWRARLPSGLTTTTGAMPEETLPRSGARR